MFNLYSSMHLNDSQSDVFSIFIGQIIHYTVNVVVRFPVDNLHLLYPSNKQLYAFYN